MTDKNLSYYGEPFGESKPAPAPSTVPPPPPATVGSAKREALKKWFEIAGLDERLVELFLAEEIDLETLAMMTEEDLVRMGIRAGPRKRILAQIARDRKTSPIPSAVALADTDICLNGVELEEELGRGSFGVVFRGRWQNTAVAVKKLLDSSRLSEFVQEAKVSALFRHPQVLLFYGLFIDAKGTPHVVSEFCPRGDLLTHLRTTGPLSGEETTRLGRDVAAGMSYLSSHNVVHRDLAARNILLWELPNGRLSVKISDFGLSRSLHSGVYQRETSLFPARWTAPEAIEYGTFSTSSDVWSFGVVLFEMLSGGKQPYSEIESNNEVLSRLREGLRLKKPDGCPDALWKVASATWSKDPSERPSFQVLHNTLEAMLDVLACNSGSPQVITFAGEVHVHYLSSGHLLKWYMDLGATPQTSETKSLSEAASVPVAATGRPWGARDPDTAMKLAAFRGIDSKVYVVYHNEETKWVWRTHCASGGATLVSGSPVVEATSRCAVIAWVSQDRKIFAVIHRKGVFSYPLCLHDKFDCPKARAGLTIAIAPWEQHIVWIGVDGKLHEFHQGEYNSWRWERCVIPTDDIPLGGTPTMHLSKNEKSSWGKYIL